MAQTALFRCDANRALGHLSRCMALADAFRAQGWTCAFAGALDRTGKALLAGTAFKHLPIGYDSGSKEDAIQTAAFAAELNAALVVLDGYDFTPEYAENLHGRGMHCAVIDDFAAWPRYPVDTILNFTIAARSRRYPPGPARLLLGPEYFPARAKMRDLRRQPRPPRGDAIRVCVVLSGDADGEKTAIVVRSIGPRKVHLRALVAAAAGTRAWIETVLGEMGAESRLRVIPADMSEDLAWADLVVCTGGMIKYESIFLGAVPIVISNNAAEAEDTRLWRAQGIGLDLGLMADFDEDSIARAFTDVFAGGLESLRAAARLGQAVFAEDPTLAAVKALTAPLEQIAS